MQLSVPVPQIVFRQLAIVLDYLSPAWIHDTVVTDLHKNYFRAFFACRLYEFMQNTIMYSMHNNDYSALSNLNCYMLVYTVPKYQHTVSVSIVTVSPR